MKRLSNWARQNVWQARITIIISWILLVLLGIYIGNRLNELNMILPVWVIYSSTIAFLIAFLFYPVKHQWSGNKIISFYSFQKSCDFIVATASFIMVIYAANKPEILLYGYQSAHAVVSKTTTLPADKNPSSYKTIKAFNSSMKDGNGNYLTLKERKKLLKTQVKAIKKADDLTKNQKTLLIILSVIVALGLLTLVASAACSISCNGSGALAVLVGVGGAALVGWLLIFVIRRITGKHKKKRKEEEMTAPVIQ